MAMVEVGVVEVVVVEAVMDAVEDVERGRLRHRRRIGLEIVVRRWNMREVCVGEQCVCGCVECGVGVPVGGGEGLPGLVSRHPAGPWPGDLNPRECDSLPGN